MASPVVPDLGSEPSQRWVRVKQLATRFIDAMLSATDRGAAYLDPPRLYSASDSGSGAGSEPGPGDNAGSGPKLPSLFPPPSSGGSDSDPNDSWRPKRRARKRPEAGEEDTAATAAGAPAVDGDLPKDGPESSSGKGTGKGPQPLDQYFVRKTNAGNPVTPQDIIKIGNDQEEMMIAGAMGGFVACLMLHPLDLLKTRMQAAAGRSEITGKRVTYFGTLKSVIKYEGITGLWRGVGPALIGSTVAWGLFAYLRKLGQAPSAKPTSIASTTPTGSTKHQESGGLGAVSKLRPSEEGKKAAMTQLSPVSVGQSVAASLVTTSLTTPIWLIKTRMCLQGSQTAEQAQSALVQSLLDRERGLAAAQLAKMEPYRTELAHAQSRVHVNVPGNLNLTAAEREAFTKSTSLHRVLERIIYPQYATNHPALAQAAATAGRVSQADLNILARMGRPYPPYDIKYAPVGTNYYQYSGLIDGIRTIYRTEGFRGLFRGLVPGLGGALQGGLQFSLYEALRDYKLADSNKDQLPIVMSGSAISIARFLSMLLTYPTYVIRTQMQDNRVGGANAQSITEAISKIISRNGFKGLYAGYFIHVLKGLPASLITAIVYEKVLADFRLIRAAEMGLIKVAGIEPKTHYLDRFKDKSKTQRKDNDKGDEGDNKSDG